MLVDDEQDILLTFKAALSPYPAANKYNIETFTDAQEALKRFLEVKNNDWYDLVITDI